MSTPVKLKEVVEAFDSSTEELMYYLDKRTNEIIPITNEEMEAAEEDELLSEFPDWQRDSILKAREIIASEGDIVALPDQFDIHEYQIMEDFCLKFPDSQTSRRLLGLIKGKGAFGRFKNAIFDLGIQDQWYEFKWAKLEEMAIDWLEEKGISYSRDDVAEVSGADM